MQEEFVQVPVPAKHVSKVMAYVVALEDEDTGEGSRVVPPPPPPGSSNDEKWSFELLERMYHQSPDSMKKILGYLADRPDKWVRSTELIENLFPGQSSSQFGGITGAFGRRVKNRYEMNTWPFDVNWTPDEHERWSVSYRMPGWVAEKIRSYRET